jgi:hypothetical protein
VKFTLPYLKKGQRLSAEVVEMIDDDVCIVNLGGDLLRVKNTTGRKFAAGLSIELEVTNLHPLSFRCQVPHR